MASRKIEDLHPDLQPIARRFMELCDQQGLDVLITCTYRSGAEQNALYEQGRSKPGPIVTRARAGQSAHNFTLNGKPAAKAFDVVPLRNGKAVWGTKGDDLALWQRVGAIGMDLDLNWYGRHGAPFKEFPHFQLV